MGALRVLAGRVGAAVLRAGKAHVMRVRQTHTLISVPQCVAALIMALMMSPAAQADEKYQVMTRLMPAIVMARDRDLEGLGIDIANEIAAKLQLQLDYQRATDVGALLDAVDNEQADFGIGAISLSEDRIGKFRFTQPILESSLRIMVPVTRPLRAGADPINNLTRAVFTLTWPGSLALLGVIGVILFWQGKLRTARFGVIGGLIARGGRAAGLTGATTILASFAYYAVTAQTLPPVYDPINGLQDLLMRKVGTTANSTAARFMKEQHVGVEEFPTIEEAAEAMAKGDVAAVVFDEPVLRYLVVHQLKGKAKLVGCPFHYESYNIVFKRSRHDELRDRIDVALASLKAAGTIQEKTEKWLGPPPPPLRNCPKPQP